MRGFLIFAGLAALALCLATTPPATAAPNEQFDSVCRISATTPTGQTEMGTGCVIRVDATHTVLLTNAHVTGKSQVVGCEFWKGGYQSQKFAGQVAAVDAYRDMAIVAIPTAAFRGVLPKAIPLASTDEQPKPGETISSTGFAKGAWPTAWVGRVEGYREVNEPTIKGTHMIFKPCPLEGRSGSPLCNAAGHLVGLVRFQAIDQGIGGAVTLRSLHDHLVADYNEHCGEFRFCAVVRNAEPEIVETQCGGACPGGSCGPMYGGADDDGLIFGRNKRRGQQPAPQPQPANPWLNLNAPPATDYGPKLGEILGELKNRQVPVIPAAPAAPPVDLSGINNTLAQHGQAIDQLGKGLQAVPGQIDGAVKPIVEAVQPLMAFHAKLKADEEAGGIKGKLAGKIDAAMDNPDNLRRDIYIVLGVIGLGLVFWNIMHNKGLLRQGLDKIAAMFPNNQGLQKAAGSVDRFEDGIKDKATAAHAAAIQQLSTQAQALQAQVVSLAQSQVPPGATAPIIVPIQPAPANPPQAPTAPPGP